MGRPKGSKNKPKDNAAPAKKQAPAAESAPAKRMGRPPGSKNAGTVVVPTLPAPNPAASLVTPPQVATVTPQALTSPAPPPMPSAAGAVRIVPKESTEAPVDSQIAAYTLEELQSPALDGLEHDIAKLVSLASPRRKLIQEARAPKGVSYNRAVLKTLLDYFEVDVKKLVATKA